MNYQITLTTPQLQIQNQLFFIQNYQSVCRMVSLQQQQEVQFNQASNINQTQLSHPHQIIRPKACYLSECNKKNNQILHSNSQQRELTCSVKETNQNKHSVIRTITTIGGITENTKNHNQYQERDKYSSPIPIIINADQVVKTQEQSEDKNQMDNIPSSKVSSDTLASTCSHETNQSRYYKQKQENSQKIDRKWKSKEQIKQLEKEFLKDNNWSREKIAALADKLGMSKVKVYKWQWDRKDQENRLYFKNYKPIIPNKLFMVEKNQNNCDVSKQIKYFNVETLRKSNSNVTYQL